MALGNRISHRFHAPSTAHATKGGRETCVLPLAS